MLAVLVGAGLLASAILVDEIGAGDEHVGGLNFTTVHVEGCLEGGAAGDVFVGQAEDVDDVVALTGQLGLSEEREQGFVAAMAVDDYNFLAAVTCHFADGFLQERELGGEAVGEGAGLLARFEDLAEVVLREDDGIFLLDRVHHGEAYVEEVSAEGKVRAVLLDDAEGEDADALRLVNCLDEVRGGEFFPFGGER